MKVFMVTLYFYDIAEHVAICSTKDLAMKIGHDRFIQELENDKHRDKDEKFKWEQTSYGSAMSDQYVVRTITITEEEVVGAV